VTLNGAPKKTNHRKKRSFFKAIYDPIVDVEFISVTFITRMAVIQLSKGAKYHGKAKAIANVGDK
jgi:hypothetical protein